MSTYEQVQSELRLQPRTWLVTGVAGFIGSHLLEALLKLDQTVVGVDNFATGKHRNLGEVRQLVKPEQWTRFRFIDGDICSPQSCQAACHGVNVVLHQAALGSVPRSLQDPMRSFQSNVTGFLNLLVAARDHRVQRFVYASSSSVYGDHPDLPKHEDRIGHPLSPYAATKVADEVFAEVFARCYGSETVGLRYFNVFGPRQDPDGPYAAVIPKWIAALLRREAISINGDGETSRDFCYVENVVQANILAATAPRSVLPSPPSLVFNVALNARTTLNQLFRPLHTQLAARDPAVNGQKPVHRDFRAGDVRHSQADISRARTLLGYQPTHTLEEGLSVALDWYVRDALTRISHTVANSGIPPSKIHE